MLSPLGCKLAVAALAMAAATAAGCGALPIGSLAPATSAGGVDMCSLMPLADVAAKSPFQAPLSQFKAGTDPQSCEYRSADGSGQQVSIFLAVTVFGKPADARLSLANARQAGVDQRLPVRDVSGLGDSAFASGVDEVGVHAIAGDRVIDANLRGEWPDTTDDAKVAAGTELVRTILSRLP